jgi:UDP-glucose:glycoprotein glucosyltransferase
LEGHCFETGTGNPPRGLQMTLGTKQDPVVVDTIVMANLGYLQLKSNPGRWFLKLREGRSSEIYDITSHENTEGGQDGQDIQVLITSFKVRRLSVIESTAWPHSEISSKIYVGWCNIRFNNPSKYLLLFPE